ncbi:tagaturonate epimerase family protein [Terriglobus aquaticus]|uniref:Tagaturonate/fructuronate epimerase n=1 Tax=Terriglobus aquaticus TaxID=940139 RepID=A0ABW9KFU5_9BACT|nr:tagaturonate epimerase family protein [Terriglobus aquaticus]
MQFPKFSFGMGDRFAHQAKAQLQACMLAAQQGADVTPVWNKSNREHLIIGSEPTGTREAADAAVKEMGWTKPYFLDADHINLKTYERFVAPCDFFTIDVADNIGQKSDETEIAKFVERHPELIGEITIPRIDQPFRTDKAFVEKTAKQFLAAVQHAGEIYRAIAAAKGNENFVAEISMDETDAPQTPVELLIILAAISDEKVPIQTIAPKFTGRFNKGVDYGGDLQQFAKEFREDLATIAYAVEKYNLPKTLKLSVHSGSDKYSIYPAIREGLQAFDAGVHVKTAGTTWLEEVIGLAEAGGDALELAKEIYAQAYAHADELCAPYATVIDIKKDNLPTPETVDGWSSEQFVKALQHRSPAEAGDLPEYNPDFRQLLHVGFKVAAKLGKRYTDTLEANEEVVARNVTKNLFERHIRPIFLG